jgi:uncharacterized protein (DUF1778 family)
MAASTARTRSERLEARITPEQKELFQRAADLAGRTLTDFVISAVQAAAEETIRTTQTIRLSARDSVLFVEALLSPGEPSDTLQRAAERYRSSVDH